MKSKKLIGTMAAAFIVCAALAFNFLVFPRVLAASPGDSEIETITPGTTLWEEPDEAAQPDELETAPGINAISKEQAIQIAKDAISFEETTIGYEYKGSVQTINKAFLDTRYLESTDPASDPAWFVLFEERTTGEKYEYIPAGYTPEEYLEAHQNSPSAVSWECRLGTDNEGTTVVILAYDWTSYAVVEVNALTGESNYWGSVGANGGGIEKMFYGDELRESLVKEVIPEPEPAD